MVDDWTSLRKALTECQDFLEDCVTSVRPESREEMPGQIHAATLLAHVTAASLYATWIDKVGRRARL